MSDNSERFFEINKLMRPKDRLIIENKNEKIIALFVPDYRKDKIQRLFHQSKL